MPLRAARHAAGRSLLLASLGVLPLGCGGGAAATPAPSAPPPAPQPVEAPPAPLAEASATPPALESAAPAAAEAPAPPASSAAPSPAAEAQREIKYIVSPEGLRVEVAGVKFEPKAEAVRTKLGIIVKVTVNATASEGRTLLAPKHGALAFAGTVTRHGKGDPEHFGDTRAGDAEQALPAGTTVKLERDFPNGLDKVRPLGNGDVLELDVGLWGLGATAADRRAVKQFFHVKAKVEHWQGRAYVEPPPSMKGKR